MDKTILFILIMLTSFLLYGGDYQFYGDLSINGKYYEYDDTLTASDIFYGQMVLNGTHRIILESADFFIHHETGIDTHEINGSQSELNSILFNEIYEARANLYPNDSIQLRIGKQKVNWGLSYLFDPTDLINPFEMEQDQMSGFYGINLVYTPTDLFSLMSVISMDKSLDTETLGYENNWSHFAENLTGGLNASFLTGAVETRMTLIYRYNEIYRPALAFSLDALGMIFTIEGAMELYNGLISYPEGSGVYSTNDLLKPKFLAEFAMERDFYLGDWSLSLLGEYFFNGSGYSEAQADLFYTDLNGPDKAVALTVLTTADTFLLGRHYGLFSITMENPDYISLSSSIIINYQDSSFILENSFTYYPMTDVDVYGSFSYISGEQNRSEFGLAAQNYLLETGITYHF